ncbi:VOC family protein [Brevibacillus ruminantium]|uniref:VOC family protein n=1 Tax=Brevibacillus ruminantium TaxID=2950604 RepID=A0ABY4WNH5_9BACL|nr:VOC family protein [Brevibacillus ruminantium]USG67637.1 VOC family protein [Brevibacillus ruminantium]
MKLSFDHLVHFLYRPPVEAGVRLQQVGFHTTAGGRHESWGTCNSLSYFGLSYVEFLSVEFPDVAAVAENPLVRQLICDQHLGEGMGQIALRTHEIERWAEHFQRQGYLVTGPLLGSRRRDDGSVIQWKMLFAEEPNKNRRIPFLIEWADTDENRLHDLSGRGVIAPHPNHVREISYIAIAVEKLDEAAQAWQDWFGMDVGEAFHDERLEAICRRVPCAGGDLLLCQPVGAGIVKAALSSRGERPFLIRFAGSDAGQNEMIFGSRYEW